MKVKARLGSTSAKVPTSDAETKLLLGRADGQTTAGYNIVNKTNRRRARILEHFPLSSAFLYSMRAIFSSLYG